MKARFVRTSMIAAVLLLAGTLLSRPARAITTPQIVASSASTQCLHYQVIGVCVWLTCTPLGCTTQTSVKVKHYMPDLVVSVYHRTGHNPWPVVAPLAPPNGLSQEAGNRAKRDASRHHSNLRFKNADAIGDPAAAGFALLSSVGFTCHSAATPFKPYYLSVDDPLAWRSGIPESAYPESLIPGARTIGQPGDHWGHVYPREGFVTQANDYKASAVIAERVADIVTRSGQPHVYLPLVAQAQPGWWPPGAAREGDASTHEWQRLQPDQSQSCHVFPDRGPLASFQGDIPADQAYVWTLWRPYSCCKRRGQMLIYDTPG
ncbi:MAG: TIGR03756 family integrating conjugative element protein [Salinisphaera sp.]|jgi:integrating conjugative element protein (TIGR03756 family)|nr:TIGR03756 family integrating conjugative element protein [Salinisphaera sp.]